MSERASIVDESRERVQNAFQTVEGEINKFQKRVEDRTSDLNKKAEKRLKKFQKELRKYEVVQRAESFREDVGKQLETQSKRFEKQFGSGLESVLGTFQIASRGEIDKLDRKLDRINRRLKALDKSLTTKVSPATSKPRAAMAE
jgi:hypothetical protein